MALRNLLGCLSIAVAVVGGATACKDKGEAAKTDKPAVDLGHRCEQLAKLCGDVDKHIAKIVDECKQAAKPQVDKGCMAQVTAVYDCYEAELCGKADKVWTFDDLRVLADRKSKCAAERSAANQCAGK